MGYFLLFFLSISSTFCNLSQDLCQDSKIVLINDFDQEIIDGLRQVIIEHNGTFNYLNAGDTMTVGNDFCAFNILVPVTSMVFTDAYYVFRANVVLHPEEIRQNKRCEIPLSSLLLAHDGYLKFNPSMTVTISFDREIIRIKKFNF